MSGLPMHVATSNSNGRAFGAARVGRVGASGVVRGGLYAKVVFWTTTAVFAGGVG